MALKRSSITKAVNSAFKVLGDIPEAAILRRTTSTYDSSTGINATSTSDSAISKAVFTRFESFEVDKVVVLASDVKLIFQQSEISVTPSLATDTLIRNSISYNILRVGQDPAAATYTLQLRAV
jgi:hypothetical protein